MHKFFANLPKLDSTSVKTNPQETDTHVQPWIEKYRPKDLNDISYQTHVVRALQYSKAENKLPHLLLYGPPGTGKTSTILAVSE